MVNAEKLNILAYGTRIMLYRLAARLNKDEVSLTGCTEANQVISNLSKEPFDMVIIDNFAADAEIVCHEVIGTTRVPVALMLRESDADWKKLRGVEVDGYLFDEAGSLEMMARIRAFSRRKPACEPV